MSLSGNVESSRIIRGKLNGLKTIHGYSAYEVAVAEGFVGTKEEWLESLRGKDGSIVFEELTEEQKELLRGPQGDPFTYDDFTPEQLAELKGNDGVSPVVTVEAITGGHRVTITDATGTYSFNVMNGKDGSGSGTGGGADGEDGVSPTVDVSAITGGHRVTITDVNGTRCFDVLNGSNGQDGNDGDDGVGISSVQQTTTSTADGGTNVITVTLSNGQKATFNVKNGSEGSSGRGVSSMVYNSSTNSWTVTYTDNTTATVNGPEIPDVSGLMPKSGGTFEGRVIASAQTASVSLLRNSKLVAADTDPTVNGEINWTYA